MHPGRSTVAVIAPSGIPNKECLERGMDLIRSWGHQVVPGRHIDAVHRYMAGTAEQRSDDLRWALEDPQIDVVWLARGGFGIQHCLPQLHGLSFADKTVIGNSDATALLQFLHLRGHRRLIHGPMVETLASDVDDATRDGIQRLLGSSGDGGCLTGVATVNADPLGRTGALLGGNLTMLASLSGTPWALRAGGAIVMLEDITEHAFRLDRSLMQLRLSGALDGVCAFVLGEFVRCHLPAGAGYTVDELVTDLLQPLGVPIVQGVSFGHGRTNLAWPYGRQARLEGNCLTF